MYRNKMLSAWANNLNGNKTYKNCFAKSGPRWPNQPKYVLNKDQLYKNRSLIS